MASLSSAATLSPTVRGVAFVLLLVTFGSKIGALPLQVPLPGAYAAAPNLARQRDTLPVTVALCRETAETLGERW